MINPRINATFLLDNKMIGQVTSRHRNYFTMEVQGEIFEYCYRNGSVHPKRWGLIPYRIDRLIDQEEEPEYWL